MEERPLSSALDRATVSPVEMRVAGSGLPGALFSVSTVLPNSPVDDEETFER